MSDLDQSWPTPWVRAVLPLAILRCLAAEPAHGYGIATQLNDHGFGKLKGGSLYPHLVALEEQGDVIAEWLPGDGGPGRKQYQITDQGQQRLRNDAAQFTALAAFLADVPSAIEELN